MNSTELSAIKDNAILLAQHHRKHCDGKGCTISLYLLYRALVLAGVELTDKELIEFL